MSGNKTPRKERINMLRNTFRALIWITTRHFSQQLQQFGLTFPQFITLAALAAHKQACTMSDLTHVTFQDPPTLTGIINRLVKMGLVARTRSETDRRIVLVQATESGVNLIDKIHDYTMNLEYSCYANLSDEELDVFEQLLHYLLRSHIRRYKDLPDTEMEAVIEELQMFINDPIYYAKLDSKNKFSKSTVMEVSQE